jgi:hypothetical protein
MFMLVEEKSVVNNECIFIEASKREREREGV